MPPPQNEARSDRTNRISEGFEKSRTAKITLAVRRIMDLEEVFT